MADITDYHIRITVEGPSLHNSREVQTDVTDNTVKESGNESEVHRDFVIEHTSINQPTCVGNSPADLKIRTNVGSAIVNDDYTVTADPDDKKWIKMAIGRDDGTSDLEILAFEKVLGDYADTPSGKTLEKWLKEFSVVAAGTVLVEEQDFI